MTNVSPKRSIENWQCALYGLFKNLSSLIQLIRCKTKTNYELVTCICSRAIGSSRLWCCDLSLHVIPHSLYKTCAQGIMVLVTNIAHQVSKRGIYKRPALRCLAAVYAITMIPARKSSRGNASLLWFWGKDAELKTYLFQYFLHSVAIADDFYHISYLWFSAISVVTSFIVGILASFAFGEYANFIYRFYRTVRNGRCVLCSKLER